MQPFLSLTKFVVLKDRPKNWLEVDLVLNLSLKKFGEEESIAINQSKPDDKILKTLLEGTREHKLSPTSELMIMMQRMPHRMHHNSMSWRFCKNHTCSGSAFSLLRNSSSLTSLRRTKNKNWSTPSAVEPRSRHSDSHLPLAPARTPSHARALNAGMSMCPTKTKIAA